MQTAVFVSQLYDRLEPSLAESIIACRWKPELRNVIISFLLFQTVKVLKSLIRILIVTRPLELFACAIDLKDKSENIINAEIFLRVYLVVDAIIFCFDTQTNFVIYELLQTINLLS